MTFTYTHAFTHLTSQDPLLYFVLWVNRTCSRWGSQASKFICNISHVDMSITLVFRQVYSLHEDIRTCTLLRRTYNTGCEWLLPMHTGVLLLLGWLGCFVRMIKWAENLYKKKIISCRLCVGYSWLRRTFICWVYTPYPRQFLPLGTYSRYCAEWNGIKLESKLINMLFRFIDLFNNDKSRFFTKSRLTKICLVKA